MKPTVTILLEDYEALKRDRSDALQQLIKDQTELREYMTPNPAHRAPEAPYSDEDRGCPTAPAPEAPPEGHCITGLASHINRRHPKLPECVGWAPAKPEAPPAAPGVFDLIEVQEGAAAREEAERRGLEWLKSMGDPRPAAVTREELAEALRDVRLHTLQDGSCWCGNRPTGQHAAFCMRYRALLARYDEEVKRGR